MLKSRLHLGPRLHWAADNLVGQMIGLHCVSQELCTLHVQMIKYGEDQTFVVQVRHRSCCVATGYHMEGSVLNGLEILHGALRVDLAGSQTGAP
jgi:hypothetical protein